MMIVSTAWSLTVGRASGPGVEPSCLGANDETGAKVGDDNADASILVDARTTPTTGAMLVGKMLESKELIFNNQ